MLGRVYIEKWWTPEQMEAARRQHDVDMQAAFGLSGLGFISPAKTQNSVQAAKQSRAAEQAHAIHQKQIEAAMQRCEKGGGMWVKGPGRFPGACRYTPRPMSGLGAEGSTGVVVGALLGALAGYALTRKGSGAFIGAMLAPPVMYAVPMRPMYSFWF